MEKPDVQDIRRRRDVLGGRGALAMDAFSDARRSDLSRVSTRESKRRPR